MHLACPDLSAALAAGQTIITPNQLLSSVAAEQHIQTQLQSGLTTWRPPKIFSIGAWLADCWQQARYAGTGVPILLSPAQERAVWQELIQAEHPALFDYAGAVGLAIAATRLMAEWHISTGGEAWSTSSDTRQFQHLLQLFRQRSEEQHWITRADLWHLLPDWIGQPWWDPTPLSFAAFPASPPALTAMLNKLGSRAKLAPVRLSTRKKPAPLYECPGFDHELDLTARWARHHVETNPDMSITLFVPNLRKHKPQIHRTLRQIFYSGDSLQAPGSESIFHIHASQSLLDNPLVANAILILELASPRIDIADAGAILRSPFLSGAAAERNERALADANLRRYRDLDVTLRDIEKASSNCPGLGRILSSVKHLLQATPDRLELPEWSEFIASLLTAAGWPGEQELIAAEQPVIEDWKSALTDLAALGLVSQKLSLAAALAHLRSLLGSRTMETGDLTSPVQVLDAPSAYGLRFDSAAIVGLSEEEWPTPHRASPFVPLQLQRPILTSTAVDRARATEALFATAPTIFATHSGHLASVARPFVKQKRNDLAVWTGTLPGQSSPRFASEVVIDDSEAPPFTVVGTSAPGGVSILKSQSQCPFQAFAKYRLAARRPEDACFGFDARDRGSFLHRALENVWRQLQTRDRLKATSPQDRRSLIHEAVTAAVGQQDDSPFHKVAGEAERARLEEVILEWLALEEAREQSFTVEHIEKDQSLQISGLPLNLRIDRVDRLRDGSAVLIDYKSGEPKLKSLEGDRPAEPQLLVYAAAMNERVEGLFFAQLKPRALKAVGWSRTTQFPVKGRSRKNTRLDWNQFLHDSNTAVQKIAAEFMSGWAAVDPQPGACTFCNLKPFCRVNEQRGASEDAEDAD